MADTVRFQNTSPAHDFTVKAPSFMPERVTQFPQYVQDQAADGDFYSYQLNSTTRFEWELQFQNLTKAERDNVQSLFDDIAGGSFNTYTHSDGTQYSDVTFAQNRLEWEKQNAAGNTPGGAARAAWATRVVLSIGSAIE